MISVAVDEGQMVAEGDELATVDTADGSASIETDVPGVVRELYVERGARVEAGAVVALIDES